ncbi:aminotransferase class V-fold PLP-dependent enzyme [Actinocorallia sp. A-T 12471]|uniref:aminotransferase class V-fold PLP-dependent enzyme n=1 Tax=Actinocorallia sp. A-T 12471 TaxID=3089813 RepID=UPI0029CDC52E|nr:aminotransferase class V-fold PLP-dependent enzyme [Actinocorallia sp. A-T 12471]MDX6742621.1 aminotransferase class V-fold PLP-dependent enzyme [Actinocorallia sp. A-T 12471]
MTVLTSLPAVVGLDAPVPVRGGFTGYANFDYAASAPCLQAVADAVAQALPYYSSVHRGAGYASQVTTRAYEEARETVREFLGGPQAVVFTRNTTDSFNLLARAVPQGTSVVVFASEHHATQLPWRRAVRLPIPASPAEALTAAENALRSCAEGPRLLVVTAASNVTGELWPIRELAAVAHRCGARIAVDAAQLAPHRPFDASPYDYVALSGHKLYAPFGAGVLAGRADWLRAADPYLRGGGATRSVTAEGDVAWASEPEQRHEAGTPNVLGAIAVAEACRALTDWRGIVAEEERLLARLREGIAALPAVRELSLWGPNHPRVGIVSFTVEGHSARSVAEYLSDVHGIGVRDGKFCAHPLVASLTGAPETTAVRASFGLGTTDEHVDRLLAALTALTA